MNEGEGPPDEPQSGEEQPTEFQLKIREIFEVDRDKQYLYSQLQAISDRLDTLKTKVDEAAEWDAASRKAFRKLYKKVGYVINWVAVIFSFCVAYILDKMLTPLLGDNWFEQIIALVGLVVAVSFFCRRFNKIDEE